MTASVGWNIRGQTSPEVSKTGVGLVLTGGERGDRGRGGGGVGLGREGNRQRLTHPLSSHTWSLGQQLLP